MRSSLGTHGTCAGASFRLSAGDAARKASHVRMRLSAYAGGPVVPPFPAARLLPHSAGREGGKESPSRDSFASLYPLPPRCVRGSCVLRLVSCVLRFSLVSCVLTSYFNRSIYLSMYLAWRGMYVSIYQSGTWWSRSGGIGCPTPGALRYVLHKFGEALICYVLH